MIRDDVVIDEEVDSLLSEDALSCLAGLPDYDAEYEAYRDYWNDELCDELEALFVRFTKDKNSYYFNADERFCEHLISELEYVTKCDVAANFGRVVAKRRVATPERKSESKELEVKKHA